MPAIQLATEVNLDLLTTFYPTLSAIMLDIMLRQAEAEEAAEGEEALPPAEPGAAAGLLRGAAAGSRLGQAVTSYDAGTARLLCTLPALLMLPPKASPLVACRLRGRKHPAASALAAQG